MIWGTWSFSLVSVVNLVALYTWDSVLGESLEFLKGVKPPFRMDGEFGMAPVQCRGIRPDLTLIWGTQISFVLLG